MVEDAMPHKMLNMEMLSGITKMDILLAKISKLSNY